MRPPPPKSPVWPWLRPTDGPGPAPVSGKTWASTRARGCTDWLMFYHGNPDLAAPGQVYFTHMIICDAERELAMTSGQTVLVGERGVEALSRRPLDLVVR